MKEFGTYQVSLKLLLFNDKNEALLLQSQPGDFTGIFDLPGGRIDSDEHNQEFAEILDREIKEEVGNIEYLLDDSPQAIGQAQNPINGKTILYVIFQGRYVSGDITLSDEHTGYKWVKLEDLNLEQTFAGGLIKAVRNYLN